MMGKGFAGRAGARTGGGRLSAPRAMRLAASPRGVGNVGGRSVSWAASGVAGALRENMSVGLDGGGI